MHPQNPMLKPIWWKRAVVLPPLLLLLSCNVPAPTGELTTQYTHPAWGVTVSYPRDWTVSVLDFDKMATPPAEGVGEGYQFTPDLDQMRMIGHVISLNAPTENGQPGALVTVGLESFTLSPLATLQSWVDLRHALGALENPLADETKITFIDATDLPFAKSGDQVVYDTLENPLTHIETIWIAKGNLVFSIRAYSADPEVISQLSAIASTISFDPEKLATIRQKAKFNGDEEEIRKSIEHLAPVPSP